VETMNKVHETLNNFQQEFQDKLHALSDNLHKQIEDEGNEFREVWKINHQRM